MQQMGNPDKTVIAISGDGGMQMNIQEFATAVLEELPLILCVFNNEYLGMVRQWQKLFLRKALWDDESDAQVHYIVVPDGAENAGIYAGFCKTGRKLWGKRYPGDEKRGYCGSI